MRIILKLFTEQGVQGVQLPKMHGLPTGRKHLMKLPRYEKATTEMEEEMQRGVVGVPRGIIPTRAFDAANLFHRPGF